ncbi:MAG: DUF2807 domain-containing protein [Tannerellaceae bacterium]|nr:DUF2807 domain-containing protein [Tannerellaceae bacterium]
MRMKINGLLICLLLSVTTFTQAADRIRGNGTLTTKEKEITDYNRIRIDGVFDILYEQSENTPYLEVTVDENLQPYVYAEVKDRILTIGFKGIKVDHFTKFLIKTNSRWLKEARISGNANFMLESPLTGDEFVIKSNANSLIQLKHPVTLGKLDLNVFGSANIVVDKLEVEKLECSISGSGSITLKEGQALQGSYSITSSGDIHAFGVAVPDLSCKVTGSGTAEVHATDNLKATLMGNGHIRYKGPTAVQQKRWVKEQLKKSNK